MGGGGSGGSSTLGSSVCIASCIISSREESDSESPEVSAFSIGFIAGSSGAKVRFFRNDEMGLGWSIGSTINKSGLDDAPTVGSGGSTGVLGFGLGLVGSGSGSAYLG